MTNTEKLQTLREMGGWYADDNDPPAKAAIDYGIKCVEVVQMLEEWIDSGDLDPDSLVRGIRARMVPK
jgi:hypothetical protein